MSLIRVLVVEAVGWRSWPTPCADSGWSGEFLGHLRLRESPTVPGCRDRTSFLVRPSDVSRRSNGTSSDAKRQAASSRKEKQTAPVRASATLLAVSRSRTPSAVALALRLLTACDSRPRFSLRYSRPPAR